MNFLPRPQFLHSWVLVTFSFTQDSCDCKFSVFFICNKPILLPPQTHCSSENVSWVPSQCIQSVQVEVLKMSASVYVLNKPLQTWNIQQAQKVQESSFQAPSWHCLDTRTAQMKELSRALPFSLLGLPESHPVGISLPLPGPRDGAALQPQKRGFNVLGFYSSYFNAINQFQRENFDPHQGPNEAFATHGRHPAFPN